MFALRVNRQLLFPACSSYHMPQCEYCSTVIGLVKSAQRTVAIVTQPSPPTSCKCSDHDWDLSNNTQCNDSSFKLHCTWILWVVSMVGRVVMISNVYFPLLLQPPLSLIDAKDKSVSPPLRRWQ